MAHPAAFWSVIVSSAAGMMFLKLSTALGLLRLGTSRWYRWSLWATMVLTVLYCMLGIMPFLLNCQPMSGYWDKSIDPKPVCIPLDRFIKLGVLNTSFNIFTDVILAMLPVPIVWNLQMKLKTRLYFIGILSLGYLAVAMGIIKAVYQIAFGSDMDKTFNYSIFCLGIVGMIAACAPTLKPLLRKILNLTSHDGSSNKYRSSFKIDENGVTNIHRRTLHGASFVPEYELHKRPPGDGGDGGPVVTV